MANGLRIAMAGALAMGGCAWPIAGTSLTVVTDVPLPGTASRFDYQTLDPRSGKLYIAHLGADSVVVFDTARQRVTAVIPGISNVHGVLWVAPLNRLYASATGSHEVVAIDPAKLRVTAHIRAGMYPDGIAFDPVHSRLFVSDERGGACVVIDAKRNRPLKTIPLGGDVGNTWYDAPTKRVLVTVGASGDLVEIDSTRLMVLRRVHLAAAKGPHGLLANPGVRIAYVACEENARLLAVDLRTFRVLSSVPVGEGPDVLAFDPARALLYVGCEGGTLSILKVDKAGIPRKLQDLAVPRGHTVAVDPTTHLVYMPLEDVGGKPLLRIFAPR